MNKKAQGWAVPIILIVLAILVVVIVILVYPSERAEMLGTESSGSLSIRITSSGFSPAEIEVPAGSRVTWTNSDYSSHTIKFLDSESSTIGRGGSYSKTFEDKGSFTYTSGYNPGFKGTVKVT